MSYDMAALRDAPCYNKLSRGAWQRLFYWLLTPYAGMSRTFLVILPYHCEFFGDF
jgi:hypothetical protein